MLRIMLLLSVLAGSTGLIANGFIQIPQTSPTPVQEENWQPLALPEVPDMQAFANQLRRLKSWQEQDEITFTQSSKQAKKSRRAKKFHYDFVGIIQQGSHPYILLLDKDNKITSYPLHSVLPNGARLQAIKSDFIEITDEGEVEIVKLYD